MPLRAQSVDNLIYMLGFKGAHEALHLAKKAQTIEDKWKSRIESFQKKIADIVAEDLAKGLSVDLNKIDFETFFVNHAFDVMFEALATTNRMPAIPESARLARKYPKGPMPRSLKELMKLWDLWRNKKIAPPRQASIAEKIKKAYIKKIQQVVGLFQEKISRGEIIEKKEVRDSIIERSKAERARANAIVETETTRYWNQARRETYDQSDDVTHYLFIAIRDAATTKWCKTRTGLVYAKTDPLLEKETPPCHWNCRSEILPLIGGTFYDKKAGVWKPLNPQHMKLIEDKSLARRSHSPEPLPAGWNR